MIKVRKTEISPKIFEIKKGEIPTIIPKESIRVQRKFECPSTLSPML
jgi:hypothetical protein